MFKSKILNQVQDPVRHDKRVILNLALKQVHGLRFQNLILELDTNANAINKVTSPPP